MGLIPVRPGELATVVTYLEMRQRPPLRPIPPTPLRLVRWPNPTIDAYRALFARVGAPWLWFSRLVMAGDRLAAILSHDAVEIHAVADARGIEVGLLELDFREAGACEIAYFALVPELTGKGHGKWLMAEALARAWRPGIERVWLHTCTKDHPAALGFYRKRGFTPFTQAIETFADPRLIGILPRDAAPQIPLFAPDS